MSRTLFVLDSGGVSLLAERSPRAAAMVEAIARRGLWPPTVPSVVLVECLTGDPRRDAPQTRLLKACDVDTEVPVRLSRRAARLRVCARRGSAIDALVVAAAEPGGVVLTGDPQDLRALASHAGDVHVECV